MGHVGTHSVVRLHVAIWRNRDTPLNGADPAADRAHAAAVDPRVFFDPQQCSAEHAAEVVLDRRLRTQPFRRGRDFVPAGLHEHQRREDRRVGAGRLARLPLELLGLRASGPPSSIVCPCACGLSTQATIAATTSRAEIRPALSGRRGQRR